MRGSSLAIASFHLLTRPSRAGAPYQSVRSSIADPATVASRSEGTSISAYSLRRHDAEFLGGASDARALVRDIGSEVGRPAEIGDLPGEVQPFLDCRINGLPNIRGDAFANSLGQGRRTEKADKAVESKIRIAGLGDRGHLGHGG